LILFLSQGSCAFCSIHFLFW